MTLRELAKLGKVEVIELIGQGEKWNLGDLYNEYQEDHNSMLEDDASYYYWYDDAGNRIDNN